MKRVFFFRYFFFFLTCKTVTGILIPFESHKHVIPCFLAKTPVLCVPADHFNSLELVEVEVEGIGSIELKEVELDEIVLVVKVEVDLIANDFKLLVIRLVAIP